ncbi:signal peptide protein [Rhodopirellula maiorica SM1]|uniref:Signal peptide protein n=2 Tax=Novipirellula TaxID=2795426 RepID=M5RKM6_9BACT|nr:hypothetical protein [Rhodopirellula maiorica]EMI19746.1 signal peptide protein [Rhodopirellula maiorica SM1]EMI20153.1 signal peptide protein [Rhodopirellula maiorica SM1]
MLNRFFFAVAPMILVASSVMAEDSMLSTIANLDQNDSIAQADTSDDLGLADVESLLNDGEPQSGEEAIAACFRRIGYGHRHFRYRSYSSWYRPVYHHNCYTPVYTTHYSYTPTYTYYTPCYTSYWGCW